MLKFEKYQGAGNDFIIVNEKDLIEKGIPDYSQFAHEICCRHFGIGADGLLILKYVANMPFMFFYNPDGSQAPMCGNGIRCFGHYLKNNNVEQEDRFTIKTLAGDMIIETFTENDVFFAKVNMGEPIFDVKKMINIENERFMREKITIDEKEVEISYIFMGTDHSVIFVNDFEEYNIDTFGKKVENFTELFPKKVNVNFVKVIDKKRIEIITWERGAGRTLACGTGATASAVLARIYGFVEDHINVKVPGGQLVIDYAGYGSEAFMTGPSEKIAEGYYIFKR
ncbi:diaminopimelate epimerase [Leptotrichia sp. OH3620_COT-345]|uniref:diaminopimelate epimerase n=1 Tax=Leptotrichia sp. OH3620_COT-345 TaxID=2491048 RepID=UPI000F654390|nr:diaminopimelate epimerase [Leptotrichia sp. OH3620_COT-345]RRD39534.1 diaminopimelate epimerase [Leptotrichia sp. OH3620_COT-345]